MWDYIVIGAGSSGCAVAHELARPRRGEAILVVEAGGSDRSPIIKVPAGVLRACADYDWGYQAQPDPSRNGAIEKWIRGRVLGGSSSINGTIYVRGSAKDFDRWSEQCGHLGGWSAAEVLPIFREMEASDQVGPLRGRTGPLSVRTVRRPHALTQAFMQSAGAVGHAFNHDYNGYTQAGVSSVQLSQRRGFRCSSADAFLKPLLREGNVCLRLNAVAEEIQIVDGRAISVAIQHRGKRRQESARDIILCAGAIDSPKLLMLSGIGDAQELSRNKIAVAIDLPGVGRNLKEHPLVRLTYRTAIETYNLTNGPLQQLGMAKDFLLYGEGAIANLFEGAAFLCSSPCVASPDIQLVFLPLGYLRMPDGLLKIAPYPSATIALSKSYPVSTGRIRLASNRPNDPPYIEFPLLGAQCDVDTLISGIRVVRRIMNSEPIASLVAEVIPGVDVNEPSKLERFVRDNTGICYHSIGTCRMGLGPDAVVGPDLRVRGTKNLWVADASIMPDHISGNTNAACMMIGAKLGRQLVARRGAIA